MDYEIEKAMDRTIIFLSRAFDETGHNMKPVIIHSIRVALRLFYHGYEKDIVIAGVLHDILEDTDISQKDLKREFGERVFNIVKANSFDINIDSEIERNDEMFIRCKKCGKPALLVKCADISDNINFFSIDHASENEMSKILLNKYHSFLDIASFEISNEDIYKELKFKVEELDKKIKNKDI